MRPKQSLYFSTSNPPVLATLNEEDTLKYLARLHLPLRLIEEPPSLDLLAALLFAHHTQVPFGTTPIHVPQADWTGEDKPIKLGAGFVNGVGGMDLGAGNFKRVVEQYGTGFCFSLNSLFASLLRGELFVQLPNWRSPLTVFRRRIRLSNERSWDSSLSTSRQGPR